MWLFINASPTLKPNLTHALQDDGHVAVTYYENPYSLIHIYIIITNILYHFVV